LPIIVIYFVMRHDYARLIPCFEIHISRSSRIRESSS
jgi:hypothetical protein